CDTEVVLNAFLECGDSCFHRLRGMFAAAVWIEPEQRLILVRDRIGIKPLYYRIQEGEIFFGSEMKCILAHPGVPRRIDLKGLNYFLSLNYVPSPLTLIEGNSKLLPGHMLEWQRGKIAIRSYLAPMRIGKVPCSLEEATEELDSLLRQSIAEQIPSDVPMAIWLSGGLDSSTITHYAAQISSSPLRTFSITFRGKSFDETQYLRSISAHYGTRHTELDMYDVGDLVDVIHEISYYSDEPGADAGAVPVWYLARMTRPEATVVLSGEGADEIFGGYLTYRANQYRRTSARIPRFLLKTALSCAERMRASDEKIGFDYKLKRFLQGSLMSADAAHVYWNGSFSEEEKARLFHFADSAPMSELLQQMRLGGAVERYLDFDQRYSLPDALLYKLDRMSMAHAVEARPPFLDDRIVDFAGRLPDRFKLRGVQTKVALRQLMKEKLPSSVLNHAKIGLDIPIHEWFRGILSPLLTEILNETSVKETGLFDWPAVRALIESHQNHKANWGYHLWGLITLMLWLKRWNVETPGRSGPLLAAPERDLQEDSLLSWLPASYSAQTS
ncbi:MAG: asparagine synthase (glutamine-hydrolyzing), partial [Acidobacteriaceae bacterium]